MLTVRSVKIVLRVKTVMIALIALIALDVLVLLGRRESGINLHTVGKRSNIIKNQSLIINRFDGLVSL